MTLDRRRCDSHLNSRTRHLPLLVITILLSALSLVLGSPSSSSAPASASASISTPDEQLELHPSGFIPIPHPHFILPHTVQHVHTHTRLPKPGSSVLVLGSGGLVGRAVVSALHKAGYRVEEVKNRRHIDLRVEGALEPFAHVDFVMFLACEVGGSKYILDQETSAQVDIMANNMKMYQVVFEWLNRHHIPFLFTSTSLVLEPDSYGSMKRAGEIWIQALKLGKIVRLWNVYGTEPIRAKSHVLADWANSCAQTNKLNALTDGNEQRNFVYVHDCADALVALMEHYDEADFISDIASPEWTTLKDAATTIANYFETRNLPPCEVSFSSTPAKPRALLEPRFGLLNDKWWQPKVTLEQGLGILLDYYLDEKLQSHLKKDEL